MMLLVLIMFVRYQVILNGELIERFSPSARVREGDLLSPYIFVLCTEKLSHIINNNVSSWNLEVFEGC